MNICLPPHLQKMIDDRVRSGKYRSPEDVVASALVFLDQQEQIADFDPGELQSLIEEGERSGPPLDGEEVLRELADLRRASHSKAG